MNPVRLIDSSRIAALLIGMTLPVSGGASEMEKLAMPPAAHMKRADIYLIRITPNPKGVLVLCPGLNGDGDALIRKEAWIKYAREMQFALIGISFASEDKQLKGGEGYYYASEGSGQILLNGIRQIFGRDLPILIYGISGGAHFTARFAEWIPERIIAWCAYSAGWWDEPDPSANGAPGIVACGDIDSRHGASLGYFMKGRAVGKPWTWVSLSGVGHRVPVGFDDFVREYFSAIVGRETKERGSHRPLWWDADLKHPLSDDQVRSHPTLACGLPNAETAKKWASIHTP